MAQINGSWSIGLSHFENYSVKINSNTSDGINETASTISIEGQDEETKIGLFLTLGFGVPDTHKTRQIVHYIFGVFLVLVGLAGVFGNGLVLYVFTKYRRLRGAGGGPLILSLASGDLMVSLLHFMPAYSSFREIWAFGQAGCKTYAALVGLGGLASLITMAVIAVDRCSVIMGRPKKWLSGKKACGTIWSFCLVLIVPPFFGWSRYVPEGLETSCTWDYESRTPSNRFYYMFLLILGFCIPVSAIIISYVGILHIICRHSKLMKGVTRNGIIHDNKIPTKSDRRTAQVILTIILCFLVSWTPYAIVSLVGQFGPINSLSPLTSAMPAIFAKASVIYNPIIYGLTHPNFRSAVRNLKNRHFPSQNLNSTYDTYQKSRMGGRSFTVDRDGKFTKHRRNDLSRQTSGSTLQQHVQLDSQKVMRSLVQELERTSCSSETEIVVNKSGQWAMLRRQQTSALPSAKETSGDT